MAVIGTPEVEVTDFAVPRSTLRPVSTPRAPLEPDLLHTLAADRWARIEVVAEVASTNAALMADEHAPDLPARNEDNADATTLPAQAAALRPIVPPPPMQPPPIAVRRKLARPGDAALRKVGYGLAAGMALRYLVPRLLRRR